MFIVKMYIVTLIFRRYKK